MFIATKFMNRMPVEIGQLTSYLRQDIGWLGGVDGQCPRTYALISLQTIFFVSQTLIERMDQCAFLLSIFPSRGFFLLPRKRGRTLGTKLYWWIIRYLTIRQRAKPMKMSVKIDFTFFEFFSPLYQVSKLLDGWNWREGTAFEIRAG